MYRSLVVDYDRYLEAAEGDLDQTWKDENIFDLWKFRDLLSNQMIKYNPNHRKYAGDTNMRPGTQQNQSARNKSKDNARKKIGTPLEEDIQLSNFAFWS